MLVFNLELLKIIKAKIVPDALYLKWMFKKHVGYELNLNDPQTFNEKLQWLKLNDKREILTTCADKLKVREYIAEQIGSEYLIPLVNTYYNPADISIDSLPDYPFIIKANHTSGTFKIVRNKKELNILNLREKCSEWLKQNYYTKTKEWQYKNIKPSIIVEKLLLNEKNEIPSDLKFSCINGKVEIIHVDSNKEVVHLRNNYSRTWEPLDFCWPSEYRPNTIIKKPEHLDLLIILAEKLAKPFPFVRVDFYVNKNRIYFGELTFHPTSGYGNFTPSEFDNIYGRLLRI